MNDGIITLIRNSDTIWICGNGGAAASANHLACDLVLNAQKHAVSLCSNSMLITAIGNDFGFCEVFTKQLESCFNFENDVLICLSTSGESENLVRAANFVKCHDGKVIGISGKTITNFGGRLSEVCTHKIIIDEKNIQNCEDKINEYCHWILKIAK